MFIEILGIFVFNIKPNMKITVKTFIAVAVMAVMPLLAAANVYDVNGDGSVTATDVTAIYNYMLNGDMTYYANSDVDGDGHVTSIDVTVLYEVLLNGISVPERLVGGDISMISRYEERGAIYKDRNGNTISNILPYFGEQGWNAMRVRLFVNPENATSVEKEEGVIQDLNYVKALGKRIKDAGYALVLDLHYSDSWADPGKQTVPAAWKGKNAAEMAAAVKAHTQDVLQALKDAGVDVAWVQVGNEVTNGMLWDSGKVAGTNPGQFVSYFHAGYDAVKAVYPRAQVILHLDNGWKLDTLNWFLTLMKGKGLTYDILGLSLYPSYWENGAFPDWEPKVQQFVSNLGPLHDAYGKPVMLVEFGMPASRPDQAKAALEYLFDNTRDKDYFLGIFYWEPEAEHDRCGYDYGAFSGGKPTAALEAFGD